MAETKEAAEGHWAVLAREYERQLKALCESDDPIGVLADWAAHAGLPEPKVLSKLAAVRSRVAELDALIYLYAGHSTFRLDDAQWEVVSASLTRHRAAAALLAPLPPGSAA